ncbi:MAG: hypothetical protein HY939_07510, partial [Gammaproteobacteria bacterium]|nr:hypothetical protein [Gammaproteobacteria bacterium]
NEILFFRHQHPDATEYLIMDDSMLPFYLPGDYVCGIKRRAEQIETVLKKSCILELEAGKKIVRRIEEGSHPQRYNLHCSNPQHPQILHDVMLLSAAPIIWHRKKECFETERREIHEKHQK